MIQISIMGQKSYLSCDHLQSISSDSAWMYSDHNHADRWNLHSALFVWLFLFRFKTQHQFSPSTVIIACFGLPGMFVDKGLITGDRMPASSPPPPQNGDYYKPKTYALNIYANDAWSQGEVRGAATPLASVLLICKNVESNKDHRKLKNCY